MQPDPYSRSYSFTDYQASSPSDPLPGYKVDAELDALADTLGGVLGNLALIQNDDGTPRAGAVTVDAVSNDLLLAIAAAAPPGPQGQSAYEIAVANGFVGTQAQWLASLKSTTPGPEGNPGADAQNPIYTFSVTTLPSGSNATLDVTGAYPNLNLAFGVPRGDPGVGGGGGALADGDYGDVVVSSAGEVLTVTGVNGEDPYRPSNAPTIAAVTGLQAALDAKADDADITAINTALDGKADAAATSAALDAKLDDAQLGAANGVASLDATGKVPAAQLPAAGSVTSVNGATGDVVLTADDIGAQPAGSYATTSQLSSKADAITNVKSVSTSLTVTDAAHNGCYITLTGGTVRTITFGSQPSAGHCSIWVHRGSALSMIISCPGGYYKDGDSSTATTSFTLSKGDKLTAFHEGGGVWAFEVI